MIIVDDFKAATTNFSSLYESYRIIERDFGVLAAADDDAVRIISNRNERAHMHEAIINILSRTQQNLQGINEQQQDTTQDNETAVSSPCSN